MEGGNWDFALVSAGGTIDKTAKEGFEESLDVGPSFARELFASEGRRVEFVEAMRKDSLLMDDNDRDLLAGKVNGVLSEKVLVTHGTDGAEATAEALMLRCPKKRIVLTGSMMPAVADRETAERNCGFARGFLQGGSKCGVWLAIDGEVFEGGGFRKNRREGRFEAKRQRLVSGVISALERSLDEDEAAPAREWIAMMTAKRGLDGKSEVSGRTVLMDAVTSGRRNAAVLLMGMGADVNARDKAGWTALMHAVQVCSVSDMSEDMALPMARDLMLAGADVNAVDKVGWTALMLAADGGGARILGLLLDGGASMGARDCKGRSARDFAALAGEVDALELLAAREEMEELDGSTPVSGAKGGSRPLGGV